MDLENLIKDTFAAHEHETPESAPVLSAARRRIHRTCFVRSRPIMVAAGVAALAVAAVTVVALNRPVDQTQVAAAPQNLAPAPAKPAIADVKMPFTLGWLPPGKADYFARRINIGATGDGNPSTSKPVYDGEYLLDVKNGHQTLLVDVQEMRMMPITDAAFKSGPGRPVTIDGWPGVESSKSGGPGGYELYLTSPHDGSVYVNVAAEPGSTATEQQLIDAGRRIAQHLKFPGSTTIAPAFGLRDLPENNKICAFEIGRSSATSYSVGTCAAMPSISIHTTEAPRAESVPGRPVQGHKTRYLKEGGWASLWILDAVHKTPIAIEGSLSEAELYDIANHVVLPK